jgi:predicted enzyme related to lactoylglutathione lyase
MMRAKSIGLVWIAVKDFKTAIKFYTEVVGLKIAEMNEEWGWAELEGHEGEGMRLGIAQQRLKGQDPVQPGQNAVLTITVDNIEKASKNLQKQGAKLIGTIEEVPGHVKLQTVKDTEGNCFQLVEVISEEACSTDDRMNSCCCH